MDPDNPNMVRYIGRLKESDMHVICHALREYSTFKGAHPGMLPFVPVKTCIVSLRLSIVTVHRRKQNEILSKLESHRWDNGGPAQVRATMLRELNDGLVVKHFGTHPERGVPIPGLKNTVLRKRDRKMFERERDAVDTQSPTMSLRRLSTGFWEIVCDARFRHHADFWLLDHCTARSKPAGKF